MIECALKLFSYKKLFSHLVNLDKSYKLPSNILLQGQEGIGKTTFALHFINYLFSKNENTKYILPENKINPDNKSYNLVTNLSHPNFYLIKKNSGKKNIEIEQIRNMFLFLNKSSFNNNKKIILIDGVEDLNISSSNSLLKSLEDASDKNLFLLTHNTNKPILDTINSRCLTYKMNFDYFKLENILEQYFGIKVYNKLHYDFKSIIISPKFLINHINFLQEYKIDLEALDIKNLLKFIVDGKLYKTNDFILNNFQSYIEIYFTKMYYQTKNNKYYENFLNIVDENNLINKFNLDIESFFIKFENKYLNV